MMGLWAWKSRDEGRLLVVGQAWLGRSVGDTALWGIQQQGNWAHCRGMGKWLAVTKALNLALPALGGEARGLQNRQREKGEKCTFISFQVLSPQGGRGKPSRGQWTQEPLSSEPAPERGAQIPRARLGPAGLGTSLPWVPSSTEVGKWLPYSIDPRRIQNAPTPQHTRAHTLFRDTHSHTPTHTFALVPTHTRAH